MQENFPYIHRDITWLDFNYRVLQEAKDHSVPLLERIRFLAIYSSNLDEFFRVRVANHRNLMRVGEKTKRELNYPPEEILQNMLSIVNTQQAEFSQIFESQIMPELRKNGIRIIRSSKLTQEQEEFIENFFQEHLLPFVQPVLLIENRIKPFLNNAALYLALDLKLKDVEDNNQQPDQYAIVKIPTDHLPRFIELPASRENTHDLILLDDVVRQSVHWLFPGYDIIETYSIKLTRDAELYIDDEYSGDLIAKIRKSLTKRQIGPASRLVFDREISASLLGYLKKVFELSDFDLYPEGRYHNNFDFFKFPSFGKKHLQNNPLEPMHYPFLEDANSIFEAIKKEDHLIHPPYHSYESVVRFFEDAASDPDVTHIKIVQYRVAKVSRIMQALMKAVKAGKQVSAFIEIKARFDEEANLKWADVLEKAGVNVYYSFPGIKVHSKMALVRRLESNKAYYYTYLSTGNFHEETVKIYSDVGLFTADERITREVSRIFSFLETQKHPALEFKHLLVGQFNLKQKLFELIDREINFVKAGKKGHIILKMNSLQDPQMIKRLYEASQSGVKIQLIIRGICSLVPGIIGFSENIVGISIVDRYLEHSRIFVFHNNGEQNVYISSADWMERNLNHRIETTVPVYSEKIRHMLLDILQIQLSDNVKGRIIDETHSNTYQMSNIDMAIRSQVESYFYIKRMLDKELKLLDEQNLESN